jgi:hypothetical protein
MRNESFLVLFFKKERRAGLVGRPRANRQEVLFCKKEPKNFLSRLRRRGV